MEAFRRALESEVDAVELDIQITKDGVLVVFHDPYLGFKTNGRGAVKRHTLAELRKLRIKGTDNERIPTVEEVFRLFANKEKRLILDFNHPKILEKLIPLIEKYDLQEQVEFTSINHRMLKELKEIDPQTQIAPAFFGPLGNHIIRKATKLQANTVHVFFPNLFLNPRMSSKLQEAGIHARAFTVNHPVTACLLMDKGVSIISNRPVDIQPTSRRARRRHHFMKRLCSKATYDLPFEILNLKPVPLQR